MPRLKAAIIGFGAIAEGRSPVGRLPLSHRDAYVHHVARVQVVAVADAATARLRAAKRMFRGARAYRDAAAMLRAERPDIVSLCTPDDTHARWLLECAAQGVRGVWCEKPLAVGRAELTRLTRRRRDLPAVQLNHWRRFIPELWHLRERLRRGEFGAIHGISGCYPEGWFRNGSHLVDLAFFLCGPLRVLWARAQGTGLDPRLTVAAIGKGGATVSFASVPRRDYNLFELELRCERARVRVAENGRRVEIQRDRRDPVFRHLRLLRARPDVTPCRWRDAFRNALGDLISCVVGRRGSTLSPVTDAIAVGQFLVLAAGRAQTLRTEASRERPR